MATIDSGYAVTPLTGRPGSSYGCFIRYSEYVDGTDFTDTPTADTKYIGFYTGPLTTAPTDKASYTWSQYAGDEMLIKYGPSNVPYETSVDPLELDDDSLYELDDGDNLTIGEYGEWHDTPLPGDRYVIMSNDNGATWGDPMKIAADSLEIEYSPDGVQDWGTIFRASDKYMRQRIGEDAEWSAPIKIVGEDAIAAPVYECELSMSSIGSDVELTVYKDGEVCADTVYYEDFYGTGDSGATEEGPTGETTDGTATIEGGTDRNKHLVKIYSDENKTELLVTGFVSYGENGATGSDSTSYWLVEEAAAIKKSAAGVFTPSAINLSAKKKQGTQGVASYAGRLKVWKTEVANPSSSDWTQLYASATNESTMATPITIQSTYKAIKCELYFEGGFTTLLDQDIIPIVDDGADGYSPTATVTKSNGVATITITDKNGTTQETVSDGENGKPLNNRGNWTANTAYAVLDCVYVASEKTSYFCKTAHTSGSTFSSTNWTILGAQGNPGQSATQYYIHFVYNDSNTTADNYSKTEPRKYIGVYTDTNSADADTFAEATTRGAVWSQSEPDELMRMYSASSVPPDGLFELDDGDNLTLVDDTDSDLEIETGGEWHTERQEGDIYCIESTDGGRTWSDPLLLTEVVKESYEKYAVSDDGVTARFWRYDRPEVPAGSWLLVKKITVYEGGNSDEVVIPTYYPADALSLQTSADTLIYSLRRDGSANYQEFTVQAFVPIEDEKQPLTAYTADTSNASGITATVSYDSTNKIATFTLKTASGGTAPKGYVTISITTGGIVNTFTKQITISATKSGKYLGLATALTTSTATVNGSSVPASVGDFVTWGGTESSSRKQTYNYQLIQTGASALSWNEYTDDADTMTSLSDIMSLVDDATNKNTKAVLLVQRLVAAEEFLHKLFVNKIKLITEGEGENRKVGAIHGGKYDEDGNVDPESSATKGVYLDADGLFKCVDGEFSGKISGESQEQGALNNEAYGYFLYYVSDYSTYSNKFATMEEVLNNYSSTAYNFFIDLFDKNDTLISTLAMGPNIPLSIAYQLSNSASYNTSGSWTSWDKTTIVYTGYKYVHFRLTSQSGSSYYTVHVSGGVSSYSPKGWNIDKNGIITAEKTVMREDCFIPITECKMNYDNFLPVVVDLENDSAEQIRAKLDKILNASYTGMKPIKLDWNNQTCIRAFVSISSCNKDSLYVASNGTNPRTYVPICYYLERYVDTMSSNTDYGKTIYRIGNLDDADFSEGASYRYGTDVVYRKILKVNTDGSLQKVTDNYMSNKLSFIYREKSYNINAYKLLAGGIIASVEGYVFTRPAASLSGSYALNGKSGQLWKLCNQLNITSNPRMCCVGIGNSSTDFRIGIVYKDSNTTFKIRVEGSIYSAVKDSESSISIYEIYT